MADLFTRLVSGPASAVPLAPRVPTMHEPSELSIVDDDIEVAAPPPPLVVPVMETETERWVEVPSPVAVDGAVPVTPIVEAFDAVVPFDDERAEIAPSSPEPRDLGGFVPPQRHKTSKISPTGLRPREPEPVPSPVRQTVPVRQTQRDEPEAAPRTTVRIEIGRIEIRAPQQPASPPAVPMPAPRSEAPQGLSLADYLRGNDGRPR